jgi:hypothetical protein
MAAGASSFDFIKLCILICVCYRATARLTSVRSLHFWQQNDTTALPGAFSKITSLQWDG